jgi:mevalonate pyrophosphate decarboxylase
LKSPAQFLCYLPWDSNRIATLARFVSGTGTSSAAAEFAGAVLEQGRKEVIKSKLQK